jgi:NitT/TauT family transport system substrate-binding protein
MLRRLLIIGMIALLSVVAVSAQGQTPTDQTFFLTFVPNVQFAPVYAAIEEGHFESVGLNVQIEHGDENIGVDRIAANELQFGLISGEEVIKARANGRPVVYVYEWFQRYPVGIVTPAGALANGVSDLAGRRVGIPGRFGASYNGLVALLSANNLVEQDIQLEAIGFNAPEVFCLGGVEAAVVYINNEPLQIEQRAAESQCGDIQSVDVYPVSEAIDMVSNGLITNEDTIANNPALVTAMVGAFDAGLRSVINNPSAAYLLTTNYVENLPLSDAFRAALESESTAQVEFLATNPDREALTTSRAELLERLQAEFVPADLVQFQVLLNTITLWDADSLGMTDPSSWDATQDVLIQAALLNEPIDTAAAFTNDFIPVVSE